jgi:hypothetical protein
MPLAPSRVINWTNIGPGTVVGDRYGVTGPAGNSEKNYGLSQ